MAKATKPAPVSPAEAAASAADTAGFLVDRLGQIKAAKAALEVQEKAAKRELIAVMGTPRVGDPIKVEGQTFRASLSRIAALEGLDDEAKARMVELFEAHTSAQYRTAHTVQTKAAYTRVDVSARNGDVDVESLIGAQA